MAFTLKTSGLATLLSVCVAVDEDGTTIKEFVSPTVDSNKAVSGSVTLGAKNWKSVSRGFFETTANGAFDFNGIKWTNGTGGVTDFADGNGASIFCAFAGSGIGNNDKYWVSFINDRQGLRVNSSGKANLNFGSPTSAASATTIPTDNSTSFSVGANYDGTGSGTSEIFYGLESGSLASDGTGTNANQGGNVPLTGIGGPGDGNGNQPAKYHLVTVFTRKLTLVEMQSLHNDWAGTLFDNSAPTPTPTISVTPSITPTVTPTATLTRTPTVTVTPSISSLVVTITQRLVNLGVSPQVNITGITAIIYKTVPTGANPNPHQVIENITSDSNGNVSFTISNTGLAINDPVWLILMKDGSPARGSIRKITPTYT